jgi:hypothetical protein
MSLPEVVMELVDRVEHSKLSLLHSRPTAMVNWSHPPERSVVNGALLLSCTQLRLLGSASLSIDVALMNNRIFIHHDIFSPT